MRFRFKWFIKAFMLLVNGNMLVNNKLEHIGALSYN